MTLGGRIALAREAAGLNQNQLADILDVKPGTVSRWESDEFRPKPRRLAQIAEKLGREVEWFQGADAPGGEPTLLAYFRGAGDDGQAIILDTAKREYDRNQDRLRSLK